MRNLCKYIENVVIVLPIPQSPPQWQTVSLVVLNGDLDLNMLSVRFHLLFNAILSFHLLFKVILSFHIWFNAILSNIPPV